MKPHPNSNTALREALARLAQKQPVAPEGMAERFMERLSEERKPNTNRPKKHILWHLSWVAAAAAAVVIAAMLWQKDDARTPMLPEKPMVKVSKPISKKPSEQAIAQQTEKTAMQPTLAKAQTKSNISAKKIDAKITEESLRSVYGTQHNEQIPITASTLTMEDETVIETDSSASIKPVVRKHSDLAKPRSIDRIIITYTLNPDYVEKGKFTEEERELDRRAYEEANPYEYLIVGEYLAAEQIRLNEILSARPVIQKTIKRETEKPISI